MPWFGTLPPGPVGGGSVSTTTKAPSHENAVSRVLPTAFWNAKSMRISTNPTFGSAVMPDMTSLMCAMWKIASERVGVMSARTKTENAAIDVRTTEAIAD